MIKSIIPIIISLIIFFGGFSIYKEYQSRLTPFSVDVRGYFRSDGTYVAPHSRRPPGGAQRDRPIERVMFFANIIMLIGLGGTVFFIVEWRLTGEVASFYSIFKKKANEKSKQQNNYLSYNNHNVSHYKTPYYLIQETPINSDINIPKELKEKYDYLIKAINHNNDVIINYEDSNGNITVRTIKPLRFKYYKNSYYIEGYCRLRNDKRTFILKRISSIKIIE